MKPILPLIISAAFAFQPAFCIPKATDNAAITWTKIEDGEYWKAPTCPKSLTLRLNEAQSTSCSDAPATLFHDMADFFVATKKGGAPAVVTVSIKTWKKANGAASVFGGSFVARVKTEIEAVVTSPDGAQLLLYRGTLKSKDGDIRDFSDSDVRVISEKLYKALQTLP